MSFIGKTEERLIKTTTGKVFKILITAQEGKYWVSTVLYVKNGIIDARHFSDVDKAESYIKASEWVLNNIDHKAMIDEL